MTKKERETIDLRNANVSLSREGFIEIGNQIDAERKEWRSALGVPQGLRIPEKPFPATEEERLAELAILRQKLDQVFAARLAAPPGPEFESLGHEMVMLRDRWIKLKYS